MALGTQEIVNKLWNLCNVLRDDGITYHQYLNELTYILFLKMAEETGKEKDITKGYRWGDLKSKTDDELLGFYRQLLLKLGTKGKGNVQKIYNNSQTSINQHKNLRKIIKYIDELDWFDAREEGLGEMYEGLLEKNASETKSGAGQYFTPRPLINVMVRLMDPKIGERLNDPACGTYGFMISAHHHIVANNNIYALEDDHSKFLAEEQFSGCELVHDTHRLAMMNAFLHGMGGNITLGDSLSCMGEKVKELDMVLANPPFGTKKGGENPTRTDLEFPSSNKQLNFLQSIYLSLKQSGKARAAVVLPDNVLFEDGDGKKIRKDLLGKCNLHTILRLPTGIFYAQGVKTNVLFFERGITDKGNTKEIWFYDLRTNMPKFGKRTPFSEKHFADFEKAYTAADRTKVKDERFKCISLSDVENFNLDLGLVADESIRNGNELDEPQEIVKEALSEMESIMKDLNAIIKELE